MEPAKFEHNPRRYLTEIAKASKDAEAALNEMEAIARAVRVSVTITRVDGAGGTLVSSTFDLQPTEADFRTVRDLMLAKAKKKLEDAKIVLEAAIDGSLPVQLEAEEG